MSGKWKSLFGTSLSFSGMHPLHWLPPYSIRVFRLERLPNSVGISPVNWL